MKITIDTNEALSQTDKLVLGLLLGSVTESKTETPTEAKPTPTKPKPKPATKKAVEKPVEEKAPEPKEEGITLASLKDRAKEKAQSAGRDKVKEVIGVYAPKLTEVSEEDYGKVYLALGKL